MSRRSKTPSPPPIANWTACRHAEMVATVGMIGLGIMGSAMSGNLLRAGCPVVGCDVDGARTAAFAAAGGRVAGSPRAVAEQADVVVTILPGAEILHEV